MKVKELVDVLPYDVVIYVNNKLYQRCKGLKEDNYIVGEMDVQTETTTISTTRLELDDIESKFIFFISADVDFED